MSKTFFTMGTDDAVAVAVDGRGPDRSKAFIQIMGAVSLLCVLQLKLLNTIAVSAAKRKRRRGRTRTRKRAKIEDLFNVLGNTHFRRSYRMPKEKFDELVNLLSPLIVKSGVKRGPNGLISPDLRVSASLRYFAGGSPYDIMLSHGISHTSFFESVWSVVDAVNQHPDLAIKFPELHEKQREIALGFMTKSTANFNCCVGAIDGILIWIEKPTEQLIWESKNRLV